MSAPTCRELERALDAYVDGELDASHVLTVDAHLTACSPCSERVGLHLAVKRSIRVDAQAAVVPASLRARIERSAVALRPAEPARTQPSWRSALPWAAAAGIALMASVGVRSVGGNLAAASPEVAASLNTARAQILEEFAVQHARPLPPEEHDPARITKVFSPIVGVPVRPVRFAEAPLKTSWAFAGARLMALRDEPTASLYYENTNVGGGRITVFVFDPNRISVRSSCCLAPRTVVVRGEERTVLVGHAKGYSLGVAEHDGVGYAVSADLGESEVVSLAANL
jgi:anti-sigma factor (TIGR02949 family)